MAHTAALSRGRKLQEREEAPHILGPIPSMAHTAHSRGEKIYRRAGGGTPYTGAIPSLAHMAHSQGKKNCESGRRHPVYWGPIPSMAHTAHSRGRRTARKESKMMLQGIKDLLYAHAYN